MFGGQHFLAAGVTEKKERKEKKEKKIIRWCIIYRNLMFRLVANRRFQVAQAHYLQRLNLCVFCSDKS